jgi:hypothetical protein
MKPTEDIDFLLSYIDDVVSSKDKELLLGLLRTYTFSPSRSEDGLERCTCAIKKLRKMETIEPNEDGL